MNSELAVCLQKPEIDSQLIQLSSILHVNKRLVKEQIPHSKMTPLNVKVMHLKVKVTWVLSEYFLG